MRGGAECLDARLAPVNNRLRIEFQPERSGAGGCGPLVV